jgi:hypothetical protein
MPVQNWHPTGPVLRQQRIHLAPARESRALATVVRERRARVPVARASCPATSVAQGRRVHLTGAWKLPTQPAPARERRAQAPTARAARPAASVARERQARALAARRAAAVLIQAPNVWSWAAQVSSAMT